MRISGEDDCHLFYCLNAYPAGTLAELEQAVFGEAAGVWAESGLPGPHAVGLWLNSLLLPSFDAARFARRLRTAGLYCPSLNGFPHGLFHGGAVKERVYTPDWSQPSRLEYTRSLAQILAVLLPEGQTGSISTLPLGYRARMTPAILQDAVRQLCQLAEDLARLYDDTGREIVLAIEPEPDCFFDASDATAQWLEENLFSLASGAEQARRLRRHIGVCLDTVHALVLFEDPLTALRTFTSRGIRVPKIQIGAALGCVEGDRSPLAAFQDGVYLHQTRTGDASGPAFSDLPQALAAQPGGEWRVHFHVPLTWSGGDGLQCLRAGIDPAFFAEARQTGTRHFEVEIYTLSVFPDHRLRSRTIFARELLAVHHLLSAASVPKP